MRITIITGDSRVGVDGVFRDVDLTLMPAEIRAIQYDSKAGRGVIEYGPGTLIAREVRDAEAEHAAALAAGDDHSQLTPIYKTVQVQRDPEPFTDFAPYQQFVDAWRAAAPVK